MAGFFGLFDYEKEGPGIDKNAPQKKTFVVFFETFFRNFWNFLIINLIHSFISMTVVLNGIACVGITNVTRNIARDKHSFGLSDFFETIKKNFKQGLFAGIINIVIYAVLYFDVFFFLTSKESLISTVGMGVSMCLIFIFSVMNYYIWTLMITFKYTLKQIYKNSFKFVFVNLKNNLICFVVIALIYAFNIAVAYLLYKYLVIVISLEIFLYILLFPAFRFLLVQFCTFPSIKKFIIDPYYAEHPDEDIDKRKNLGIDVDDNNDNSDI